MQPVKRGPGRPPDPGIVERRRRELIEAAYRVFARKGYAATGVADIVGELGVGRGTFYRYFDNKRDILLRALEYGLKRMMSAVYAPDDVDMETLITAHTTPDELIAYIRGALERVYELLETDPGLVRVVMFELSGVDDQLTQRLIELNDFAAQVMSSALRRGIELGLIAPETDTDMAARMLNAATVPAVVESLRGELTPEIRNRLADTVVQFLRGGLLRMPGQPNSTPCANGSSAE